MPAPKIQHANTIKNEVNLRKATLRVVRDEADDKAHVPAHPPCVRDCV